MDLQIAEMEAFSTVPFSHGHFKRMNTMVVFNHATIEPHYTVQRRPKGTDPFEGNVDDECNERGVHELSL